MTDLPSIPLRVMRLPTHEGQPIPFAAALGAITFPPQRYPSPKARAGRTTERDKPEGKDDRTEAKTPDPCSVGN